MRDLSGAHPFDGTRVANLLPSIADELGIAADQDSGVVVMAVRQGSTAARVGFRPGDVIVQVGRATVASVGELEALLRERQRVWHVVFRRGSQVLRLQLAG
jgi:S1-C subfamily serine protease